MYWWHLVLTLSAAATTSTTLAASDYVYFRPAVAEVMPLEADSTPYAELVRRFYGPGHDFSDYSRHATRSSPILQRHSAGSSPQPSGPYFAHELKESKKKPQQRRPLSATSWNVAAPNEELPVVHRKKPKTRTKLQSNSINSNNLPATNYKPQQVKRRPSPSQGPALATKGGYHINQLDKVSDPVIGQSIATAYPNGVMGTLSLLAGVVWYLVNKSATPVVKMRSGHGGTDSDVNTFDADSDQLNGDAGPLMSLLAHLPQVYARNGGVWDTHCQRRAACEIAGRYPALGAAAKWFRPKTMQLLVKTAEKATGRSGALTDGVLEAAGRGADTGGADCAHLYAGCPIPFANLIEARDR